MARRKDPMHLDDSFLLIAPCFFIVYVGVCELISLGVRETSVEDHGEDAVRSHLKHSFRDKG